MRFLGTQMLVTEAADGEVSVARMKVLPVGWFSVKVLPERGCLGEVLAEPCFLRSLQTMCLPSPLLTLTVFPQPLPFHDLERPPVLDWKHLLVAGLRGSPVEGDRGRWQWRSKDTVRREGRAQENSTQGSVSYRNEAKDMRTNIYLSSQSPSLLSP